MGPTFTLTGGDFLVVNDAGFGTNGSAWFVESGLGNSVSGNVGSIVAPSSTTFVVNSIDIWTGSGGGFNTQVGDITFEGTLDGGGTVSETLPINTTGTPFTTVNFSGTALNGAVLTSLAFIIPPTNTDTSPNLIDYIALDDFNFTSETTVPPTYAGAVLADSPISFWQFNDGSGTVAADSVSTNDGNFTNANTPNWVGGWSGQDGDTAVAFSTGQYINVANAATGAFDSIVTTDQVTVEFWAYGDLDTQPRSNETFNLGNGGQRTAFVHLPWEQWEYLLGCWDELLRGLAPRLNAQFQVTDYAGKWNHYAFVKDGTTNFSGIYINGELTASRTNSTDAFANPSHLRIGTNYTGALDDVAIYDKALSADQIRTHFEAAFPTAVDDPVSAAQTTDDNTTITVSPSTDRMNYALASNGGVATQSTTGSGGVASRGIDGNTNGQWAQEPRLTRMAPPTTGGKFSWRRTPSLTRSTSLTGPIAAATASSSSVFPFLTGTRVPVEPRYSLSTTRDRSPKAEPSRST